MPYQQVKFEQRHGKTEGVSQVGKMSEILRSSKQANEIGEE